MARFHHDCISELRNANNASNSNNNEFKSYTCTSEGYCLYCCCNSQCCFVAQRRTPRHLWEAWYFWLGIALLAVFIISSVSSYIVSNYRHKIQGISFQRNPHVNGNMRNNQFNQPRTNRNQISISIIASSGTLSSQRKTLVIGAQPSLSHMTPIVA